MLVNYKVTAVVIFLIGALYYGWPIIEALILVLPIPDPKEGFR